MAEPSPPAAGVAPGPLPTYVPPVPTEPLPAVPAAPPQVQAPEPPRAPTWSARAAVPRKRTGLTQMFTAYQAPVGEGAAVARVRRSGASRFFIALLALVLILAVPVVSAYVSYKLASGENPFEWPPTMDLSKVF